MQTPKQFLLELIDYLPEDATLEYVIYAVYVRWKMDKGINIEHDNRPSHDEIMQELTAYFSHTPFNDHRGYAPC